MREWICDECVGTKLLFSRISFSVDKVVEKVILCILVLLVKRNH